MIGHTFSMADSVGNPDRILGMNTQTTPLLALALDPAAFGSAESAARVDPGVWLELVDAAERGGAGLVTLADTHRAADGVARLDALMLLAYLGARTEAIGIMAAADTTVTEPYLLASQVATADFVSAGRAGWLVQVSGTPEDAGYVGPRAAALGTAAWAEAAEFITVVRALWDSWEDDAVVRDIAQHRFIDRERIHHIDFAGEHLTVKGPSITPRSPQAQPPLGLAVGAEGPARELAVSEADVVFVADGLDPTAVRAAAGDRELRLLRDLPLETATADEITSSLAAGFDGVRLIVTTPSPSAPTAPGEFRPGDLEARLQELAPTARPAQAGGGTLRGWLGLTRPANRFAAAASSNGAAR
jgi:alkanesulfonate monooxygenase SsuD/methylene tetrahydromethanopterin reductase-like flavin-dependent oxidoreductase (luciferase family)